MHRHAFLCSKNACAGESCHNNSNNAPCLSWFYDNILFHGHQISETLKKTIPNCVIAWLKYFVLSKTLWGGTHFCNNYTLQENIAGPLAVSGPQRQLYVIAVMYPFVYEVCSPIVWNLIQIVVKSNKKVPEWNFCSFKQWRENWSFQRLHVNSVSMTGLWIIKIILLTMILVPTSTDLNTWTWKVQWRKWQ